MSGWGLTKQEKYIILFLILSFVAGMGIRYYKMYFIEYPNPQIVDYQRLDSLRQEFIKQSHADTIKNRIAQQAKNKSAKYPIVNINTATLNELTVLPRIGPVLGERIIKYREENGPFKSTKDLCNVRGIGDKTYDRLKAYITIN